MKVKTGLREGQRVERVLERVPAFLPSSHRACQGWRCLELATWNLWASFYCYSHAIRAGWLPGPVLRSGDQTALRVA